MTITLEQVVIVAAQIAQEHPDAINPMRDDHDGCAYTRTPDLPGNTENTAEHCYGGMVLLALGHDLPPEGKGVCYPGNPYRLEYSAVRFLQQLQRQADDGGDPISWAQAFRATLRKYDYIP
jgi:hypothetical protein